MWGFWSPWWLVPIRVRDVWDWLSSPWATHIFALILGFGLGAWLIGE